MVHNTDWTKASSRNCSDLCRDLRAIRPLVEGQPSTEFPLRTFPSKELKREQVLSGRIVQVGALGKFSPGVRYAFEVYQVAATAENVTASGS